MRHSSEVERVDTPAALMSDLHDGRRLMRNVTDRPPDERQFGAATATING